VHNKQGQASRVGGGVRECEDGWQHCDLTRYILSSGSVWTVDEGWACTRLDDVAAPTHTQEEEEEEQRRRREEEGEGFGPTHGHTTCSGELQPKHSSKHIHPPCWQPCTSTAPPPPPRHLACNSELLADVLRRTGVWEQRPAIPPHPPPALLLLCQAMSIAARLQFLLLQRNETRCYRKSFPDSALTHLFSATPPPTPILLSRQCPT
jgi:hypothetical protein